MYPYKVVHLPSPLIKKSGLWKITGHVDSLSLSKQLEALLIEEAQKGYELFSIVPVTGNVDKYTHPVPITIGLIVTFKEKAGDHATSSL